MYSHHCESEPQKQPVPGPSEFVVFDPEDTFNDEELAFEPEASPDDLGVQIFNMGECVCVVPRNCLHLPL